MGMIRVMAWQREAAVADAPRVVWVQDARGVHGDDGVPDEACEAEASWISPEIQVTTIQKDISKQTVAMQRGSNPADYDIVYKGLSCNVK